MTQIPTANEEQPLPFTMQQQISPLVHLSGISRHCKLNTISTYV